MAYYKKNSNFSADGKTAEDRALTAFADAMIDKIQSIQKDWKKPWFTEGSMRWPKNLSGRSYNGQNALMLMLLSENKGYKLPVFCTFDRVAGLNYQKDKQGKKTALTDDKGEKLPHVTVNKGEHSYPVFITTFTVVDKETKARINYDDYKQLSNEEKQKYSVYPHNQVYAVFNVDQTNMKEARPELYAKLEAENAIQRPTKNNEEFSFPPFDKMLKDQSWICPINLVHQDNAYYSISKNAITLPEKSQFKDGESFYSTALHEMAHSTGAENQLNRLKPEGGFGSAEYSREELVAELSSALVSTNYGITKNIKEDSVPYLKSWLENLKESPEYIKTTLQDVKRASSIITQKIDGIQQELDNTVDVEQSNTQEQKPQLYSSVAYLQSSDDTQLFDRLQENDDYGRILQEATEYDNGDSINVEQTYKTSCHNAGDDVLAENDHYAVVYNNSVGGTYDILRKVTEQDVRDSINRYGLPENATDDVKDVAKAMVAEEFSKMTIQKIPAFEMASGDILYVEYNQEKDTMDVGTVSNSGLIPKFSFPYDHDFSLDSNLEGVNEKLTEMAVYQAEVDAEKTPDYYVAEGPVISDSQQSIYDNREALDNFLTDAYWAARRDTGFIMCGFEDYKGKEAIRLENEKITGNTYYLVSRDASQGQDKYFMHLYDGDLDKEVFTSREMPHDRDAAQSFMRGAFRELEDYDQEKLQSRQQDTEEEQHFRRGR